MITTYKADKAGALDSVYLGIFLRLFSVNQLLTNNDNNNNNSNKFT